MIINKDSFDEGLENGLKTALSVISTVKCYIEDNVKIKTIISYCDRAEIVITDILKKLEEKNARK